MGSSPTRRTPFPDFVIAQQLELGLDTFGNVTVGADGRRLSYAHVIRNVIDEAVLADSLGVDFFGVGEHHRDDFAISAPEVVLAAIAARTTRILLGSAVTVLSSDEPVRVFERFATLNAASKGRAEVILGRGSFTESFPLFGYDLNDYERLFEEKVELFAALLTEKPVTWQGTTRAGLTNQRVYPTTESGSLKTWIGVGGSPQSVVRGGSLWHAAGAGDHWRRSRAIRAVRRPVSPVTHQVRQAGASGRSAFSRLYRRHRPAGPRRAVAEPQADVRPDRCGTGLEPNDAGAFRPRADQGSL